MKQLVRHVCVTPSIQGSPVAPNCARSSVPRCVCAGGEIAIEAYSAALLLRGVRHPFGMIE